MISFSILAPDSDRQQLRLLKAFLSKSNLPMATVATTWDEATASSCRHVLSVGKAALDTWHDFGLIGIGAHHGHTFTHEGRAIMVVHHPGTLMQLSLGGYEARDEMMRDLMMWRKVLEGRIPAEVLRMTSCGPCMMKRKGKKAGATGGVGGVRRPAEFHEPSLDGVGLCDDHWRGRAKIRTRTRVKAPKPGTRAAQIPGQTDVFGVLVVPKKMSR